MKQTNQKSAIFVIIGIFLHKCFKFQIYVSNRCHDLLMMSMKLSDVAILNIKSADYHSTISGMRESVALNLMQKIDLTKKSRLLYNINFIIIYKKCVKKF